MSSNMHKIKCASIFLLKKKRKVLLQKFLTIFLAKNGSVFAYNMFEI